MKEAGLQLHFYRIKLAGCDQVDGSYDFHYNLL